MPRPVPSLKVAAVPIAPEVLLVDFKRAAEMLSLTVWSVRHLHWSKQLVFKKVGRRFLAHVDDVRAFANKIKAA